jgi:transposase
MSRHELTDAQWAVIQPLIPQQSPGPGRRRADDRQPLNGILFVLQTGCTWEDVPRTYGSPTTGWRRFQAWTADGTWDGIWRRRLRALDAHSKLAWAQAFLDGSVVPAKQGDRQRADKAWPGLERHDGG